MQVDPDVEAHFNGNFHWIQLLDPAPAPAQAQQEEQHQHLEQHQQEDQQLPQLPEPVPVLPQPQLQVQAQDQQESLVRDFNALWNEEMPEQFQHPRSLSETEREYHQNLNDGIQIGISQGASNSPHLFMIEASRRFINQEIAEDIVEEILTLVTRNY